MEKHLVRIGHALAWAALSLGACAQSQVTLGGNLDAGLRIDRNKESIRQVSSNALMPSRLTFGMLEDLGGGWRAQAVLEAGLTVDDGAGAVPPPGGSVGSLTFGRFAAIALGNDRTGYLSMGRQYTPLFTLGASGVADVFGGAGLGGSNLVSSFTVRASNAIAYTYGYTSRTLLRAAPATGLGVAVLAAPGESVGGAGNQGGFNVSYGDGKWWAGYGLHVVRGNSAAINPAAADNAAPLLRQQSAAAAYNFGTVKVNAGYNRGYNGLDTAAGVNRAGWYVGGSWVIGLHELRAFYGRVDDRRTLNADYSTVQLGYSYALSKLTQLYALAGHVDNSATSSAVMLNTSPAVQATAGRNSRSVVVGILQRF